MAEHITNSPKISKEPWEMTEKEFESLPWQATEKYVRIYWHGGLRMKRVPFHKVFVKEALEEGKPVPEKVLKDYPELKKKYTQHFKGADNPIAQISKIPKELQNLAEEARKYKSPEKFIDKYAQKTDYWNNESYIKEYGYLKVGDFVEVIPSGFGENYKAFVTGFMINPKYGRGVETVTIVLPANKTNPEERHWLKIYGKEKDKVKVIKRWGSLKSFWEKVWGKEHITEERIKG